MNYIKRLILIEENTNTKEYSILIGKNAKGNEEIIKMSHPESLWFHFNNVSSSHIILQNEGNIIPKRYINQVAGMLFEYKKNVPKNSNVIYTQVKNVKLTNVLGTVIPSNTKLIKF
jgi:predicted ribosome quality control (RQC) complex YloA/Tae2 family protein